MVQLWRAPPTYATNRNDVRYTQSVGLGWYVPRFQRYKRQEGLRLTRMRGRGIDGLVSA